METTATFKKTDIEKDIKEIIESSDNHIRYKGNNDAEYSAWFDDNDNVIRYVLYSFSDSSVIELDTHYEYNDKGLKTYQKCETGGGNIVLSENWWEYDDNELVVCHKYREDEDDDIIEILTDYDENKRCIHDTYKIGGKLDHEEWFMYDDNDKLICHKTVEPPDWGHGKSTVEMFDEDMDMTVESDISDSESEISIKMSITDTKSVIKRRKEFVAKSAVTNILYGLYIHQWCLSHFNEADIEDLRVGLVTHQQLCEKYNMYYVCIEEFIDNEFRDTKYIVDLIKRNFNKIDVSCIQITGRMILQDYECMLTSLVPFE